jgi:outer membrane protein assembly factor BamE
MPTLSFLPRCCPAVALAAAFALTLTGCASWANFGVHRIDIQQGNVVTAESVSSLKVGMSRADVRNALGVPLLQDAFHADRWDYYFSSSKGGRELERENVTLIFKDDKLASISGKGLESDPARRTKK